MNSRSSHITVVIAVLSAVMLFSLMATTALAAPSAPTLGLTALQTKLDTAPGGVLHGYMKTVLKGATIQQIPVDVQAVAYVGPPDSVLGNSGALILFEATGPEIAAIGGIAMGMSGSPIYVSDRGVDKLVGAVSYGDAFTRGGTGLATPIEDMVRLQTDYSGATVLSLSRPVASAQVVSRSVFITRDPSVAKVAHATGSLVVRPLAQIAVGGMPARSAGFQEYEKHMAARGFDVVALGAPRALAYAAPFQPGSSVAALASRGDLWTGGVGTVTYVDGRTVVALGHPAYWKGDTSLEMANAWIDGVWPSTYAPYKIATPGSLRGTITQDRSAGVLGIDGLMPLEARITATATNVDTGRVSSAQTFIPRFVINSASYEFSGLPQLALYIAATRLYDSYKVGGSAVTTTTVVVSDGTDTYTLQRSNVFDSGADIATALVNDVSEMVMTLQGLNQNGLAHADILSVDLQSSLTSRRNTAALVDVECPGGLKIGVNRLLLRFAQYGTAATQTIEATLTLPPGTQLKGTLVAVAGAGNPPQEGIFQVPSSAIDRRTVAKAVADMRTELSNHTVEIFYNPGASPSLGDGYPDPSYQDDSALGLTAISLSQPSIETTVDTDWYLTGEIEKATTSLTVRSSAQTIPYGGSVLVAGRVNDLTQAATVAVYGRTAGSATETVLARAQVASDGSFLAVLSNLKTNMRVTCRFEGDDEVLASEASIRVSVAARVGFRASSASVRRGRAVVLTGAVTPSASTGVMVFQTYFKGRWVTLATRTLSEGKAALAWRPRLGVNLARVRYMGCPTNAGAISREIRVAVTP